MTNMNMFPAQRILHEALMVSAPAYKMTHQMNELFTQGKVISGLDSYKPKW